MVPSGRRVTAPWRNGGRAAGGSRLHHPAQRDHDPHPGQQSQLGLEIRTAVRELGGRRLVPRRGATGGGGDVAVAEREAVVPGDRARLVREPETVQRLVQPAAARVTREHAAGAVRAVRRGREPDDEQSCPRVAEAGHGLPPVGPVPKLALLFVGDAAAVDAEPGTALAGDDGAVHGPERAGRVTPPEASG